MKRFFSLHLDFFGFLGSMLCAIHCALLPLLLGLGILNASFIDASHSIEVLFMVSAVLIALSSLSKGYFKHHRNATPIVISMIGFAILFLHHDHGSYLSSALMVLAGTLIAVAHIVNWRLIRSA